MKRYKVVNRKRWERFNIICAFAVMYGICFIAEQLVGV